MSANDKVFLAIPCRRGIDDAYVLEGLMCPAVRTPYKVELGKGPLICNVFTGLWCLALNSRARQGWTRWALHHSDIQAQMEWLDIMAEEMDRTGADILAGIPCLKERTGVTSTGVYDAQSGGRRRLTLKEIHRRLPPTFGIEDVTERLGHTWDGTFSLIVNSALMLWRFDKDWVDDFPGFHIDTKIGYLGDGRAVPVTMPEDWNASFWASERNLKVMATRKVKIKHHGEDVYDNSTPWGIETDPNESFPQLTE